MRGMKKFTAEKIGTLGRAVPSDERGEFACYYWLLSGVLIQAIDDYVRGSQRAKASAEIYLNSEDDMNLFSFSSICSYLHLDVKGLRTGIQKMEKNRTGWKKGRKALSYKGKSKSLQSGGENICTDEEKAFLWEDAVDT